MTVTLSAQQILFIHARLIEATGGKHGVLYLASGTTARCGCPASGHFRRRRPVCRAV
jgi:hypothetical protein